MCTMASWWLKCLGPWKIQTEFVAPSVHLSQSQLLQEFGKQTSGWKIDLHFLLLLSQILFFFFWRLKKVIEYSLIFTLKNYSFLKIYQTGRSLPSAGSYRCMPPEVWANPGQSQKLGLTQSVCLWVAGCNTWAIPCCLPGYTPARELKLEGNWHSEGSCWYCSVRNQCPKQLI